MQKILFFMLLMVAPKLWAQPTISVEGGVSVLNIFRNKEAKNFNQVHSLNFKKIKDFELPNSFYNNSLSLKAMQRNGLIYGLTYSNGYVEHIDDNQLIYQYASWRSYEGYLGYMLLNRKKIGLDIGFSTGVKKGNYSFDNNQAVNTFYMWSKVSPELNFIFLRNRFLGSPFIRLKYEPKVSQAPSNSNVSIGVKFLIENKRLKIDYVQSSKYSPSILFLAKNTSGQVEWDFGDGTKSSEQNPQKAYSKSGVYSVELKSYYTFYPEDSDVLTRAFNSATKTIEIYDSQVVMPSVIFDYAIHIQDKQTVIFKSKYQEDIIHYQWDFGDGEYSNENNPTHRYDFKGKYKVKLTIRTNDGKVATQIKKINL